MFAPHLFILLGTLASSPIFCQLTCNVGSSGSVTSQACTDGTCQTHTSTVFNVASTTYTCIPSGTSCLAGTLKLGNYQSTITKCCSSNDCNTGTATTDSNTLWCNFGQKGGQSLGAQSCPSGGSCATATQTTSGVTTVAYSCVTSGCVSGTTSGVTVLCCTTNYCNSAFSFMKVNSYAFDVYLQFLFTFLSTIY